jgi:hypothetical protein
MLLNDFLSSEKSSDVADAVIALVRLAADPGAAERVADIKAAIVEHNEAAAAAQAEQKQLVADRTAHTAALAAERAAHNDKMDREQRAFASERQQALDKIRYQGAETERLHAQAKIAAEAAEKIKTELAERLENVKRAAAA